MKKTIGLILAVALSVTGCKRPADSNISIIGSTSVAPLVEAIAQRYKQVDPSFNYSVQAVGSSMGIIAMHDGSADIGMSSRDLNSSEAEGLKVVPVAIDAVAIIVNPSNPVGELTKEQAAAIFSGTIKNWREVGGEDQPIIVVSREAGSGTRSSFEEQLGLIGSDKSSLVDLSKPLVAEGTGAIKANIVGKKEAIGYVSLGVLDESVKPVILDGVAPTEENVYNESYPLIRPLLLLEKSAGNSDKVDAFMNFALSDEAQSLVTEQHFLSIG